MTILLFILILGIIVFVHELGHFIFAKKAGMYVHEASLGMGPKLYSFNRKNDETLYSIRLFPIGGFVNIAGEDNDMQKDNKIDASKLFSNKSIKDRFLTLVAGAMFNFLFAIIVIFITGLIYGSNTHEPIVAAIKDGYPASSADIAVGDKLISINGQKIRSIEDAYLVSYTLSNSENKFVFEDKNGNIKTIDMSPKEVVNDDETSYIYGINYASLYKYGFFNSIKYAFINFFQILNNMTLTLKELFTGSLGVSNLSGPVGIYSVVDQAKSNDTEVLFRNISYLLVILSINVGFINLLPFPAFDGGRIMFLAIEKVKGKKVNPNVENYLNFFGFMLLMGLMVFITYQDILKLIH